MNSNFQPSNIYEKMSVDELIKARMDAWKSCNLIVGGIISFDIDAALVKKLGKRKALKLIKETRFWGAASWLWLESELPKQ